MPAASSAGGGNGAAPEARPPGAGLCEADGSASPHLSPASGTAGDTLTATMAMTATLPIQHLHPHLHPHDDAAPPDAAAAGGDGAGTAAAAAEPLDAMLPSQLMQLGKGRLSGFAGAAAVRAAHTRNGGMKKANSSFAEHNGSDDGKEGPGSIERRARLAGMPKEELRRYQRMFRIFDTSGDGAIDRGELKYLLNTLGIPKTDQEVSDIMTAADGDGSGGIEFGEFLKLILQEGGGDVGNWTGLLGQGDEEIDFHQKSAVAREHVRAAMDSDKILPDSLLRGVMDSAILVSVVFYGFSVGLHDAGQLADADRVVWAEALLTVFGAVDIVLRFRTGVMKHQHLVTDAATIRTTYMRGWLLVDLLASVPLDLLLHAAGARGYAFTAAYNLRLLRTFRLRSLFQKSNRGLMGRRYVAWHFRIVPWLRSLAYVALACHALTCVWLALRADGAADAAYVDGVYFVMYTLTSVGYGDIAVEGTSKRTFAILLFIFGTLAQGTLVGYLTTWIMQSDIDSYKVEKMNRTLTVLEHFDVPEGLQEEVLAYEHYSLQHNLSSTYTEVIACLPEAMQDQVSLYVRIRLILLVAMFRQSTSAVHCALAESLKDVVVPPDEFIIVAGEQGHEMFFLAHGFSDVSAPDGKYLATIAKGGFFGEVALLVDTRRTANIKALTFCALFVLRKEDFDIILKQYPSFAESIADVIEERKNKLEIVDLDTEMVPESDGDVFLNVINPSQAVTMSVDFLRSGTNADDNIRFCPRTTISTDGSGSNEASQYGRQSSKASNKPRSRSSFSAIAAFGQMSSCPPPASPQARKRASLRPVAALGKRRSLASLGAHSKRSPRSPFAPRRRPASITVATDPPDDVATLAPTPHGIVTPPAPGVPSRAASGYHLRRDDVSPRGQRRMSHQDGMHVAAAALRRASSVRSRGDVDERKATVAISGAPLPAGTGSRPATPRGNAQGPDARGLGIPNPDSSLLSPDHSRQRRPSLRGSPEPAAGLYKQDAAGNKEAASVQAALTELCQGMERVTSNVAGVGRRVGHLEDTLGSVDGAVRALSGHMEEVLAELRSIKHEQQQQQLNRRLSVAPGAAGQPSPSGRAEGAQTRLDVHLNKQRHRQSRSSFCSGGGLDLMADSVDLTREQSLHGVSTKMRSPSKGAPVPQSSAFPSSPLASLQAASKFKHASQSKLKKDDKDSPPRSPSPLAQSTSQHLQSPFTNQQPPGSPLTPQQFHITHTTSVQLPSDARSPNSEQTPQQTPQCQMLTS